MGKLTPFLRQRPQAEAALRALQNRVQETVNLAIDIQQIPAPTFGEQDRAAFIEAQFTAIGLTNVGQDEIFNVYGRLPSSAPTLPPVIISAHSDTVFPIETNLSVKRDGRLIYAPGLGDNALGVAAIVSVAKTALEFEIALSADIWFVANTGEEGLGNLRGMRRVTDRFGGNASYLVVEGGGYGHLVCGAIGIRRFQIEATAPGGHSWSNFGNASAIHTLGRLIAAIDELTPPTTPRTTYNVGVIEGGTSINSIAQSAKLLLDLRSEDDEALATLIQEVETLVRAMAQQERNNGVEIKMTPIGERPSGQISPQDPFIQQAEAALRHMGQSPHFVSGSTDCNIPLSRGYTAVCVGLTTIGNAHRLDEFVDPADLPQGLGQLFLLALQAGSSE